MNYSHLALVSRVHRPETHGSFLALSVRDSYKNRRHFVALSAFVYSPTRLRTTADSFVSDSRRSGNKRAISITQGPLAYISIANSLCRIALWPSFLVVFLLEPVVAQCSKATAVTEKATRGRETRPPTSAKNNVKSKKNHLKDL